MNGYKRGQKVALRCIRLEKHQLLELRARCIVVHAGCLLRSRLVKLLSSTAADCSEWDACIRANTESQRERKKNKGTHLVGFKAARRTEQNHVRSQNATQLFLVQLRGQMFPPDSPHPNYFLVNHRTKGLNLFSIY